MQVNRPITPFISTPSFTPTFLGAQPITSNQPNPFLAAPVFNLNRPAPNMGQGLRLDLSA